MEIVGIQNGIATQEPVSINGKTATRDYYKVMLTSLSGQGKTYSFRNMNPDTTGFINIEDKPLPFKNLFKFHARPVNVASVFAAMESYANNPAINCIVIDSFSAFIELLLSYSRRERKGFDIWNLYNEEIGRFWSEVKKIRKEVFITSHYEILNIEGNPEKRVKVKGKEWEGFIEKEFTIVLYAECTYDEKNKPGYFFRLRGQGLSAKCPPAIFGEEISSIPNDSQLVMQRILDFVN